MSDKNPHIGSSFDDFLAEAGILEETKEGAVKRVLAWQLEQAMEELELSKNQMAKRMNTSRSQLNRILDPEEDAITLKTLRTAAHVVGRKLVVELV